jgi:transcriptional regulator with XRE-family HTH domain
MPEATTTNVGNSFAILLRECRKRAGLSQQQLADYLAESPKRISKWERGVSDPPGDPAFYESLRHVPGFTESDIALLLEAREVDESATVVRKRRAVIEEDEVALEDSISALLADFTQKIIEEKAKVQQKIAEVIERKGILLHDRGNFAASGQKNVMDAVEYMKTVDDELPDELKPIGQAFTQIITSNFADSLTMLSAMGLEGITRERRQVIEDSSSTVEVEQRPFHEFFTSSSINAIIPKPMPSGEGENGYSLAKHISDLQSQAKFGSESNQRPIPYPHEHVVFHAAQLQAEAKSQEKAPAGSGIIYERGRLTTLTEASRVSGVKLGTLYNYLNSGKLTVRGRIIASAPGGGKVLIDLDELDSLPQRPVGRPMKSSKPLSSGRPRGRPRKNP